MCVIYESDEGSEYIFRVFRIYKELISVSDKNINNSFLK